MGKHMEAIPTYGTVPISSVFSASTSHVQDPSHMKDSYQPHSQMIPNNQNRTVCTVCNRRFPWESSLIKHMRHHTGDRPFPCDKCDKRFFSKPDLLRHERTHTGERPYQCHYCEHRTADPSDLRRHIKRKHKV